MREKILKNDSGVTELIGTMILLCIAVCVMSYVYITVFENLNPESVSNVEIVGRIEQNNVVLEHQGGDNLNLDSEIIISIGGRIIDFIAIDYLDNNAISDGMWNIGERLVYPASEFDDIEDLRINIDYVVDSTTNSMIMYGLLQDGNIFSFNGMGAIWLFDENTGFIASDSSGNNNTGTLVDGKWNDTISVLNSSIYFDEVDDYVNVENSFSLTMTDQISIEAWFNPLGNTASIDDYSFDSAFAYNPDVIHISEDIFAISYIDSSSDVILKTLIIEEDGNIDGGWIDLLDVSALDTNSCNDPNLVHINDTVYGVCYSGDNHGSGWVKTFRINESGIIFNDVTVDTLMFDSTNCYNPNITHVYGDIYAIAYEGQSNGTIKTIEISSNGNINPVIVDCFEFDTDSIEKPRIIKVNSSTFAIAYISKFNNLVVKTVDISPAGIITDVSSFTFDTNQCNDPDIVHISDDVYAISYASDMKGNGNVITFEIDNLGVISDSIDSLIFDNEKCEDPDIIKINGEAYTDYFAIAYASSSPHVGQVITVEIQPDGQIDDTVSYEFVYNGHHGFEPKILPVFGDLGVYLVVYRGYSPHVGYISTTLTVTDPTLPKDRGLFKDGVFSIYSNASHIFGSINDVTISAPISLGWTHVALTFDGEEIKLYLDGSLAASISHTGLLNTNSNDIKIGYLYHGYIDEIYVYEYALFPSEILTHYNEQKP
ncbi:LamG domain-containing protein [Thermoplasmatota archaeon]